MTAIPRPYRDERDLEKMRSILTLGRQSANGSYYVHPGDLDWWLYYLATVPDWDQIIFLWDGPHEGAPLDGWALLSPDWRAFDVFVKPALRASPRAASIYTWAEEQAARLVRIGGGTELRTMWVLEDDAVLVGYLERRGFVRDEGYLEYLEKTLDGELPYACPPPGYQIRQVAGEDDGRKRAMAAYGAFGSQMPFDAHWSRYQRFMGSPAYEAAVDLVVIAPDGRFASFCICWFDSASQVGLFEPVGVHPDFRRLGLAKAVIHEGMRCMQTAGMRTAMVCAESDNVAAARLYRSLGFDRINRIRTYWKAVA